MRLEVEHAVLNVLAKVRGFRLFDLCWCCFPILASSAKSFPSSPVEADPPTALGHNYFAFSR